MKNQKGITLIALVVTIIVLLILAGISIAMLTGRNGVLNRATEARYENIIGEFDENVKLAQVALKTHITSNMVAKPGYIATAGTAGKYASNTTSNFGVLTKEIADELKATLKSSGNQDVNTEGYTVESYLDKVGTDTDDGEGYIVIWYTSNTLRASLPSSLDGTFSEPSAAATPIDLGQASVVKSTKRGKFSVNEASLCYVIKVENYDCKLSNMIITDNYTAGDDLAKSTFKSGTTLGSTYPTGSGATLKPFFKYLINLN